MWWPAAEQVDDRRADRDAVHRSVPVRRGRLPEQAEIDAFVISAGRPATFADLSDHYASAGATQCLEGLGEVVGVATEQFGLGSGLPDSAADAGGSAATTAEAYEVAIQLVEAVGEGLDHRACSDRQRLVENDPGAVAGGDFAYQRNGEGVVVWFADNDGRREHHGVRHSTLHDWRFGRVTAEALQIATDGGDLRAKRGEDGERTAPSLRNPTVWSESGCST
ncbi:hypothetical protein VY88_10270 [Azospirillum thiophilum]|uniref:Uncharacterized protein n=1 Tax=Azospirillum thiophilum TaxID=528244 RepID=A0AAC8ZT12_9PROT|nr:hypothetical protein AL072_02440 [Azospirillum thiophilum]KJR66346.1 hypothetical protein VY88_10270 [Azospirillum thiophilum]